MVAEATPEGVFVVEQQSRFGREDREVCRLDECGGLEFEGGIVGEGVFVAAHEVERASVFVVQLVTLRAQQVLDREAGIPFAGHLVVETRGEVNHEV